MNLMLSASQLTSHTDQDWRGLVFVKAALIYIVWDIWVKDVLDFNWENNDKKQREVDKEGCN